MMQIIRLFFICLLFFPVITEAKEKKYKYQIAVAAMFQNEADWMQEWIEYHRLIGVEHFYLFDNGSTDHFKEVLRPYIKKGIVDLYSHPEVGQNQAEYLTIQKNLMFKSLGLAKGKVKWLAFIDLDEFIFPVQSSHLLNVLNDYDSYGGVYANWLCFGTSHVEKVPPGMLMIEALNLCASQPAAIGKSIVRPERVSNVTSPHYLKYKPPYLHVTTNFQTFSKVQAPLVADKLLIYHYITRDMDHAIHVKVPRRNVWGVNIDANTYLQQMEFLNEVQNLNMHRFIPSLKSCKK